MDTRWWILLHSCVYYFFTDFIYEEPSILVQRLTGTATACLNSTDTCLALDLYQFNLAISVFSWGSAVGSLIAGIVVDRYGSKLALWISATGTFTGTLMLAAATYASDTSAAFAVIVVGRLVQGISSGAAIVISHRMKAAWFLYRELALSFSVNILFGRLGSAFCFLLLGGIVSSIGLRGSLWLGFAFSVMAAGSSAALAYLDQRRSVMVFTSSPSGSLSGIWRFIRTVDGIYWWFILMVSLFYGVVLTFVANGPNYLAMVYGLSEATSSYLIGIIYDVSILALLSGWLTDRYGYRQHWLMGTAVAVLLGLLLLYLVPQAPPAIFILFIGLGYTTHGPTAWSSIPLIVPPDAVGVATGTGKFLQYTGVGVLTAVAGAILNMKEGTRTRIVPWDAFLIYLTSAAGVCLLASFVVTYLNRTADAPLTPSQAERDRRNALQEITPLNLSFGTGSVGRKSVSLSEPPVALIPEEISPVLRSPKP